MPCSLLSGCDRAVHGSTCIHVSTPTIGTAGSATRAPSAMAVPGSSLKALSRTDSQRSYLQTKRPLHDATTFGIRGKSARGYIML